jgi:hypothetical protein
MIHQEQEDDPLNRINHLPKLPMKRFLTQLFCLIINLPVLSFSLSPPKSQNSGKIWYLYCSLSPYLQSSKAQIPTTHIKSKRPNPSLIPEGFSVQMSDVKSEGERLSEREL